jgi:hypothetical protein
MCGRPADPVFEEPWAHEAQGYRIRHDLTSTDRYRRTAAELEQHLWAYKDARFWEDDAAADSAWRAFWHTKNQMRERGDDWLAWMTYEIVRLAAIFDDVDRAARVLLEWYPLVDTRDLETDNERRTDARSFVSSCIYVLEREASIDHPREAAVDAAMRDVAARAEEMLTNYHHDGFRRIGEVRALHRSRAAIVEARRSHVAARDGLPTVGAVPVQRATPPALDSAVDKLTDLVDANRVVNPRAAITLADAALAAVETHDDTGALDALVRRLEEFGTVPSLLHLLRARRHVAAGDLRAAMRELGHAARATDRLAPRLRPQIHATYGRLRVLQDPDALDEGIAACRTGRRLGLRWWRRTTAADTSLARLLLWRALRPGTPPPARQAADVREAVRLARRLCRPWHRPGADERLVLQDALVARDALSGAGTTEQRRRAWRRSVDAPWSTAERARLATAWVAWAVGTGAPELAAEAYQHLVALVPLDAAARYGAGAKQRVLAAAQEHTEEAGYWLARTRRYRDAVMALETGRAVGLSEVTGRDGAAIGERLRAVGRADLAEEYRHALAELDEQERHPSPRLRRAWADLRDVARRVAAATGADPLALDVTYDDITAATGDGALVYIAAAKAGGYALIVAARHDPQFVELPKLDRATVAALLSSLLPSTGDRSGPAPVRDLMPVRPRTDPLAAVLKALWDKGMRDLLLHSARGSVVTLVPVGLLSLLPLHAAGEPGTPGDQYTEWRHAGHFSAIRYAPNARGLRQCRDTARDLAAGRQRLLAVDVPDGFGTYINEHLRYVARETTEVMRRWTGPGMIAHDCTWEEFRDTADEYTVWHLACHGSAKPRSILDSRLCFTDKQVTLRELRVALRPGRRRLAVLSACESNVTGATVPNEVVGLPSALLQIGFSGVIASSWKVDDLATAYLMTAFYRQWCQEGHEPVIALNLAQQWLRTATRADLIALLPGVEPGGDGQYPYLDPRYWAAFAYTGA